MLRNDLNTIIVASAARFEALHVLTALARLNVQNTFVEVGIGAITASAMAMGLTDIVRGRDILFVGSCGTSSAFSGPELFAIDRVEWAPLDVRLGKSYLVKNAEPELRLNGRSDFTRGLSHHPATCSSGISLVENDDGKQMILENLELYSVAKAWQFTTRSFTAILGTTNHIGPNAHAQWQKNFKAVAEMTGLHFESTLKL